MFSHADRKDFKSFCKNPVVDTTALEAFFNVSEYKGSQEPINALHLERLSDALAEKNQGVVKWIWEKRLTSFESQEPVLEKLNESHLKDLMSIIGEEAFCCYLFQKKMRNEKIPVNETLNWFKKILPPKQQYAVFKKTHYHLFEFATQKLIDITSINMDSQNRQDIFSKAETDPTKIRHRRRGMEISKCLWDCFESIPVEDFVPRDQLKNPDARWHHTFSHLTDYTDIQEYTSFVIVGDRHCDRLQSDGSQLKAITFFHDNLARLSGSQDSKKTTKPSHMNQQILQNEEIPDNESAVEIAKREFLEKMNTQIQNLGNVNSKLYQADPALSQSKKTYLEELKTMLVESSTPESYRIAIEKWKAKTPENKPTDKPPFLNYWQIIMRHRRPFSIAIASIFSYRTDTQEMIENFLKILPTPSTQHEKKARSCCCIR